MVHAVAAGGAGQHLLPYHAGGHIQQGGLFSLTQRPVGFEGVQVGPQLLQAGHAGEHHSHAGHPLEEAEGPARHALLRPQDGQAGGVPVGQPGQPPAPQGLHHPDGDMAAVQLLRLGPGALEVPVQVVELELAELHVFPIGV